MQKADRIGPPWDIVIEDEGRDDEEAGDMMDEKALEADALSSIDEVFYRHVVDVVEAREDQEESGEVICPKMGFDIWISDSIDAGDEERDDEDDIAVDPDVVGDVVVFLPIDRHRINITSYLVGDVICRVGVGVFQGWGWGVRVGVGGWIC